jgi:phosphoglycerate kinase
VTNRFRTLDDVDVKSKRVLLRVDLNVPMENGRITDATRLERVAPTITEISDKGGKVILLAHFGRPKGRDAKDSLKPVAAALAQVIKKPVAFADDCIGEAAAKAVAAMKDGDILCLENTRFHKEEEKNDPAFVAELAKLGDIWVNDAFSAAHRAHASTEGLGHKLPAYAGRTMQAELTALEKALEAPTKPVIAIIGGAKVSTKIDLLENLVTKVDALVIGGGMANTFLHAQGVGVGKSLAEKDLAATALRIMEKASAANCAIILPVDAVVAYHFAANSPSHAYGLDAIPADGMILDVGPHSRRDRRRQDAGLERPARRIRDDAVRPRHNGSGQARGRAHQGEETDFGCRWRRHRCGAEPGRRGRRFFLCFDGRRRLPRMDGRQTAARRGSSETALDRDLMERQRRGKYRRI